MSAAGAVEAFAPVIALLPEASLVVSADGVIRLANARAGEALDHAPAQLPGRNIVEFETLDPQGVVAYLRMCSRSKALMPGAMTLAAREGRPVHFRCEGGLLIPASASAPASLLLRLLPKEAAVNRFVALNLRIDELGKEIARRQRAEAALREAASRKDEFLAMLAHELRNPLSVLGNGIQVLRASQLTRTAPVEDRAIVEVSEAMERQMGQLSRLVDDLLDVSRMTSGKITLRRTPTRLDAVIEHAIESVQPVLQARAAQLSVTLPPRSVVIEADLARVAQVLGNLLTNAVKFSDAGARIAILADEDAGQAVIRVRDSGIGIAPEMLQSVFELFTQADHSLARSQGGLGVGLTIAKLITELHGGSIEARSDGPGRGSEFVVRLPLAPDDAGETVSEAAPAFTQAATLRKVLVVDDNADAAASLAMLLRLWKHDVRVVHDGESALRLSANFRPDLVLLDVGLPGMDGYEVARRLRQQPEIAPALIVAVTGYGRDADRLRAQQAGFDHHLTKPVVPEALQKIMK